MFYVETFINILLHNKIKVSCLLFFALSFVYSICFHSFLSNKLEQNFKSNKHNLTSFVFLINKEQSYNSVIRKLNNLPGIDHINMIDSVELAEKVKKIDSNLKIDINYLGFKVSFKNGIHLDSVKMVKNYLSQLIDPQYLIIGRLHFYSEKIKSKNINWNYISYGVSLTFLICFCVVLYSFQKDLARHAYLITQYQHTKYVSLKLNIILMLFFYIFVIFTHLLVLFYSSRLNLIYSNYFLLLALVSITITTIILGNNRNVSI